MSARLLLLSTFAHGLRPPPTRVAPATRRSAWLDLSLLLAEGPEIEGASAPVGPIAAAIIAVSGYTFEARKARSEELSRELSRRFKEEEKLYVPINVYFHSLLFSIYSFVGEHAEHGRGRVRGAVTTETVLRRRGSARRRRARPCAAVVVGPRPRPPLRARRNAPGFDRENTERERERRVDAGAVEQQLRQIEVLVEDAALLEAGAALDAVQRGHISGFARIRRLREALRTL